MAQQPGTSGSIPFPFGEFPLSQAQNLGKNKSQSKAAKSHEEQECDVCGEPFSFENLKDHKKNEIHKSAFEKLKKNKKKTKKAVQAQPEDKVVLVEGKEKYRMGTERIENTPQNVEYVNTLVVFLALRYCLVHNDVKISVDNVFWEQFGDVVVEIIDQEQKVVKIHAFQIKQTQYKKRIPISTICGEKGKFSLKKQCEIFDNLKRKKDFDKAFFTLFTVSDLLANDLTRFVFGDSLMADWNVKKMIDLWRNREVLLLKRKTDHLANTTEDPDNICKFKIFHHEDQHLDTSLAKFTFLINQNEAKELKEEITKIIDEKFASKESITNDLIKSLGSYFTRDANHHHKLFKKKILQEISELIFEDHCVLPDNLYKPIDLERWNQIVNLFDIIIIKNQKDLINMVYACLNQILPKIGCSSLTIRRGDLISDIFEHEIFKDFDDKDSRTVSLSFLYTCLRKCGLVPHVVEAKNEGDLMKIIRVISALHSFYLPLKVILATDLFIDNSMFPGSLQTMINLQDLADKDDNLYQQIVNEVEIPILSVALPLKEIITDNKHFLCEVTPGCLLNMYSGKFSYSDKFPLDPEAEDLEDNTLVVTENVLRQVKSKLKKKTESATRNLEYVVYVEGRPTRVQVPADMAAFSRRT